MIMPFTCVIPIECLLFICWVKDNKNFKVADLSTLTLRGLCCCACRAFTSSTWSEQEVLSLLVTEQCPVFKTSCYWGSLSFPTIPRRQWTCVSHMLNISSLPWGLMCAGVSSSLSGTFYSQTFQSFIFVPLSFLLLLCFYTDLPSRWKGGQLLLTHY